MNLGDVVWVGLAGGAGAVARFVVDGSLRTRIDALVPAGTVVINLSGSLLLGLLTGLVLYHSMPGTVSVVAGTGFCGGYTTFSTASLETVRLIQQGHARAALLTGGGTLLGASAAAALGLALAAL